MPLGAGQREKGGKPKRLSRRHKVPRKDQELTGSKAGVMIKKKGDVSSSAEGDLEGGRNARYSHSHMQLKVGGKWGIRSPTKKGENVQLSCSRKEVRADKKSSGGGRGGIDK